MKNKFASILYQVIIHLILIGLIFGLFILAASERANSRSVKQQILEKQIALMIDAAMPGTTLIVEKQNTYGNVNKLEIKDGKVFAFVNNGISLSGYPYFSKYNVSVENKKDKILVKIR